jgi:hypothetical protein
LRKPMGKRENQGNFHFFGIFDGDFDGDLMVIGMEWRCIQWDLRA